MDIFRHLFFPITLELLAGQPTDISRFKYRCLNFLTINHRPTIVLPNFRYIIYLNISEFRQGDLSNIRNMTSLTLLRLSDCRLTDLSLVTGLINLTELDLSNNLLTNLDGLESLTKLSALTCNRNNITDISGIPTQIVTLSLSHNKILNTIYLTQMNRLLSVDLSFNPYVDITPLNSILKLESLYLVSCNIQTIIDYFSNLDYLDVSDNPFEETPDWFYSHFGPFVKHTNPKRYLSA